MSSEIELVSKKTVNVDVQQVHGSEKSNTTDNPVYPPKKLVAGTTERLWLLESALLVVAAVAVLSAVALIHKYNGKSPPPTLIPRLHVSLNSSISAFSTVFKIAMLVPVSACLAQLKWTWFAEGNKLSDYQVIDKSNGNYGAFMLLLKFRGRRLACLGALITLAALALDFAFQSLVVYVPGRVDSTRYVASIPRRFDYTVASDEGNGSVDGGINQDMLAALYAGVYSTPDRIGLTPTCATGNCTWDPYVSIGVCSGCMDISNTIQSSCGYTADVTDVDGNHLYYCNYTLPDGLEFDNSHGSKDAYMNLTSLGNGTDTEPYGSIVTPLTTFTKFTQNFTQVDGSEGLNATVIATKCMLAVCAKKFHGQVVNGTFTETVIGQPFINSTANTTNAYYYSPSTTDDNLYLFPDPSFYTDKDGKPARFVMSSDAWTVLNLELQEWWKGDVTAGITGRKGLTFGSDVAKRIYYLDLTGLRSMMENLATSLTNVIRVSQPGLTDRSIDTIPINNRDTLAVGIVLETVSIVQAQWYWLTYPLCLLLLSSIFLIITAINSSRAHVTLWKGNSLAPFTCGLTHEGRLRFSQANNIKQVEEIAEEIKVKMVETDKGGRLVQI